MMNKTNFLQSHALQAEGHWFEPSNSHKKRSLTETVRLFLCPKPAELSSQQEKLLQLTCK